MIVFLLFIILQAGCTHRFVLGNRKSVAVVTEGIVNYSWRMKTVIDMPMSNHSSRYCLTLMENALAAKGYKVSRGESHFSGTFLDSNDLTPVLLKGADTLLRLSPLFASDGVNENNLELGNQIRHLSAFLHSQRAFRGSLIPRYNKEIGYLRERYGEKILFLGLMEGLDKKPISGNTKFIWAAASTIGSGGMVSAVPHRYSELTLHVFLVDLTSGEVMAGDLIRVVKEGSIYELINEAVSEDFYDEIQCKVQGCDRNHLFYNPFKP